MLSPSPAPGAPPASEAVETDIPARLDRLPWSKFHWLLVVALGVTWVLDGLEVTVVGAISNVLRESATLGLRAAQVGIAQSCYLAGAITGALVFGYLTDRLGRKRLFTVTLLVYLAGAILTALSWNFWTFALFRGVTGLAIGGEYSAINSAIDELIPARVRGRVDLAINGTFWLGAIFGAGLSLAFLDPNLIPKELGWRLLFGLGGLIGLVMIFVRHFVPESPRWLLTHGRHDEAERTMKEIEEMAGGTAGLAPPSGRMKVYPGTDIGFGTILHTMLVRYRGRAFLGLVLIASQAFFYNGITFTYPLVLKDEFKVPDDRTGIYMVCMAVANLLGPLLLGHFFDTVGRRKMIAGTYALSGAIIIVTEVFFLRDQLTAVSQTVLWCVTFFFASAAASAGYLTVSEIFPLEMRALAIALFYAIGTAVGGLGAPALFGRLIDTHQPLWLFSGYLSGALLMIAAAGVEWWLGLDTEGKALEDVVTPLTAEGPRAGPSPAAKPAA